MRAVTWQGRNRMSVEDVPDPRIQEPDDIVIRVTSSGLCGSDLHLYEPLAPFMEVGDVVGHEPIGVVEEVGPDVSSLRRGDRVVVPFNLSCGRCWMCARGLQSQCETTQNVEQGTGASLFGYSKLYGQVPGAQAEYLRVPFADRLPIKVPEGPPDDRFVFLSDVLPTAWQAVDYAGLRPGDTLLVLGAGPIGDMCARIALMRGIRVFVVDPVPERLQRVSAYGAEALVTDSDADTVTTILEVTSGRGADAVIDAVGMEAHGSPVAESMAKVVGLLPDRLAQPLMRTAGVDRLAALHLAIDAVRRGGTVSVVGVYGGPMDPMPLMEMFDKQVQLRMGQANVRRWSDEILALLLEPTDHLGVETFATHHLPLEAAPAAYRDFRDKNDGMVKVLFQP
ncbi:alcohol dehydrogenase catalytic domain-containing protein [Nocardioides daeguensis]|uniref:Zinc-dependent alcohol dehydrogenase n=1 Tax=Nocardioides daeguensis TaxID=908359 RepID=A0ABP6VCX2_9ACTN|nr:alcohol dehydrogenase catalytic domain-containing protein [Nocardioides daeguensis]MBV6726093.1 alcohol dehydrogenase catalytic domain-containing protein [Nocardioides daeguensis]MCR1771936.1 alcohol dehydrogenase catalytic domain-containing protein [Nocardioides daeguensis]